MQVREKTRKEIEEKFSTMGDYVKMDYLLSCLKQNLDFDTRKFVLVKLAGLYENRRMYANAGKMIKSAAEINTTFQNKIEDFVKAAQLFIRGGNLDDAEICIKNANALANERQKKEILDRIKGMYKTQAKYYLTNDRRKHAMTLYEKLLTMELEISERAEVVEKLSELYQKLGKIRELSLLRKKIIK